MNMRAKGRQYIRAGKGILLLIAFNVDRTIARSPAPKFAQVFSSSNLSPRDQGTLRVCDPTKV